MAEFVLMFLVALGTSLEHTTTAFHFSSLEACESAGEAMRAKIREKKFTAQVYYHCAPTR